MGRRILPLTIDRIPDLPGACSTCVYWELGPVAGTAGRPEPRRDKEAWLTSVLLEWGSPGRVAYVDDAPAGYLTYAPPALVPRATAFPTAPISDDAVLLMTGRVVDAFADQGLGRVLVQHAARDLLKRGVRAIEVYGTSGPRIVGCGSAGGCVLPVDFLGAVGFRTVRDHPRNPRLRLDLRTALTWRSDVEAALDRLLAPVRQLGQPGLPVSREIH